MTSRLQPGIIPIIPSIIFVRSNTDRADAI
jgi:hypothetical protein